MDSPFLVLNLRLNIVNSVGRLHLEGDSLARKGLDEYLHLELLFTTHFVDKNQYRTVIQLRSISSKLYFPPVQFLARVRSFLPFDPSHFIVLGEYFPRINTRIPLPTVLDETLLSSL